jgi:hypothetical protein
MKRKSTSSKHSSLDNKQTGVASGEQSNHGVVESNLMRQGVPGFCHAERSQNPGK